MIVLGIADDRVSEILPRIVDQFQKTFEAK